MNRRNFLKSCGALLVLPALSNADGVAKILFDAGVESSSLVCDVSYAEFQEKLLRQIASAMQVPSDVLCEDFKKVDYLRV